MVATANIGPNLNTSSFFVTLRPDGEEIREFKNKHTIFGEVVEGLDVLDKINQVHTIGKDRPLQNIRIKHTMIIEDPFEDRIAEFGLDPAKLRYPSRSPSPVRGVVGKSLADIKNASKKDDADEDDEHIYLEDDVELETLAKTKTEQELKEEQAEAEAKGRQQVLALLDDLPDADIKPPDNVLFVCKLNPVT